MQGALRGDIVAGTARLAASVELAGDTTLVARRVVLSGRSLTVQANGHRLRVYLVKGVPGEGWTSGGAGGGGGQSAAGGQI